jgi:hypothetical protein
VVLAKSAGDSKWAGPAEAKVGRTEKFINADSDLDPHPRWRRALTVL